MSETTRPIYKLFGRTKALFSIPHLHQKTSHVPTKTHVLSASRKETRPTQKMDLFKMYLLLNMRDFICHILLVGRKESLRKHHPCWDFFWDESWWIHGHPTKNSKNNMICRCHSYSKSHANFKQFWPNVSVANSKLQTQKITWFWGRMRALFWQKFHKQFPWIIYLHCHPIIHLDRFGKNNSTSGICKSMRIHAVIFVQPMCLEKPSWKKISWCSSHDRPVHATPFLHPPFFFCVHRTRFNDIAFQRRTCQARDWKNHRPPTGYLQVLRINDSNIKSTLDESLIEKPEPYLPPLY